MTDFDDIALEDRMSEGYQGEWEDEDDQWDDVGLDSPTDFDEHEMNADDCCDASDQHDIEYDR